MSYIPSCATDCGDETLNAVGDTGCPNLSNVELAEINELYLSQKSNTLGVPENPYGGTYTEFGDNEAAILAWKAGEVNNTTAGKVRYLEGVGTIAEPTETAVTLGKGKIVNIGTKWMLEYTVSVINAATEQFFRKLMTCKGEYHFWFATDTRIYGGQNPPIGNIEKVSMDMSAGRGGPKTWKLTIGVNSPVTPVSDPKPW